MSHEVFISYSSHDKPIADAVCAAIEQGGYRCWIAPRDIRPGEVWGGAIIKAINTCKLMIVIFSGQSNVSRQVIREVERAVNAGVLIVPFRVENVKPTGPMEYFLSCPHWLDAITPPLAARIVELVSVIDAINSSSPYSSHSGPLTPQAAAEAGLKPLQLGDVGTAGPPDAWSQRSNCGILARLRRLIDFDA